MKLRFWRRSYTRENMGEKQPYPDRVFLKREVYNGVSDFDATSDVNQFQVMNGKREVAVYLLHNIVDVEWPPQMTATSFLIQPERKA